LPSIVSRWSLRRRLAACATGASLITAAVGAFALWSNNRVADQMNAVQELRLKPLVRLDIVGRTLESQRAAVLATLAATNDVMQGALEKRVVQDKATLSAGIAEVLRIETDTRERALLGELSVAVDRSQSTGLVAVLEKLRKGQFVEADVASQQLYRPQLDQATKALDKVIQQEVELAEQDYAVASTTVARQASVTFVATVAALFAGLGVALLIATALQRALGAHESDLARGAMNVSQGCLGYRIPVDHGDSESVAANLNTMASDFSSLVRDVAVSAHDVANVAQRLSHSSGALAERTSDQATSLEETAASMEELGNSIALNSEHCGRTRKLAEDASALAYKGGGAIDDVAATMGAIAQSSKRTADVVSVIDAISLQTNILSLNAAVEAARVGEEGRGFAIVAKEVGALSKRSAAAAAEIRKLTDESTARTRLGAERVEQASVTMKAIISAFDGVTKNMVEIASSSREQTNGIEQVNATVAQLDRSNQSNAELAERTSRDAHEMSRQADVLVASVSRFSVTKTTDEDIEPTPQLNSPTAIVSLRESSTRAS